MLGYPVNLKTHKVTSNLIKRFQKDFNRFSKAHDNRWGRTRPDGHLDVETLKALEVAVRWSKKRSNESGIHPSNAWQNQSFSTKSCRTYAAVEEPEPTSFVEVMPSGTAKLRNVHNDHPLRADIHKFERHGPVVFALISLPPQEDLPNGRREPFLCPCLLAAEGLL